MDNKRLQEIASAVSAITPGRWEWVGVDDEINALIVPGEDEYQCEFIVEPDDSCILVKDADADFIAAAPQIVRELLAEVERLRSHELAYVAAAKSLLFAMPDFIIDALRECAGNTNAELVRNWCDKLKEAIENPAEYATAVLDEYAQHAKTTRELRAENAELRSQLARVNGIEVNERAGQDGD